MSRLILIYLLLFHLCSVAVGQQIKKFGLAYRYGTVLNHHVELKESFSGTTPQGFELSYLVQTDGSEEWERVWNYPDIGVSMAYLNFGDPRLGEVLFSTLFIRKYIGDPDARFRMSFKLAPGIAYANTVYDQETNDLNTFVSTRFNMVMEGNFLLHYRLSPHINLSGGLVFTHYSNGAIKQPNTGFNIPGVSLGMVYSPHPERYVRNEDPVGIFTPNTKFQVRVSPSWKMVDDTQKTYFALTMSAQGMRYLSRKFALNGAIDFYYNGSIKDRVDDQNASNMRIGLALGPELVAGPNSLIFQVGYYVYRPEDVDKSIYWRVGVRHLLTDHILAGLYLKAHNGKADILEWSLGYRF